LFSAAHPDVQLAIRLALQAGAVLHATWRMHPNDRPRFATKSSQADVVTETDKRCEEIVFEGIRSVYPAHGLLGEESHETEGEYAVPAQGSQGVLWIVDPIDGTNNFVHQQPSVAVSIGVLCGQEVVAAVVHRPTANETYYATKGGGAWRISLPAAAHAQAQPLDLSGAERLRVSNITQLSAACVATEMGYARAAPAVQLMLSKVGDYRHAPRTPFIMRHPTSQ